MRKLLHAKRNEQVGPRFQLDALHQVSQQAGADCSHGAPTAALLPLQKTHPNRQTSLQAQNQVSTGHSRGLDILYICQHLYFV